MQRRQLVSLCILLFGSLAAPSAIRADVTLHSLFTDNMVLQRGMRVPVWGKGADGEQVTVRIDGKEASTAVKDGVWRVELPNLSAGGPFELTVKGNNELVRKNVLVGEVWICSGQSNMQWSVRLSADPERTISEATVPGIRLFTVPRRGASEPESEVKGEWVECNPDTIPEFSAVAFAFGKELRKHLDVPIGLINTSYGGTPAQAWTSVKRLERDADLRGMVEAQRRAEAAYDPVKAKAAHADALAKWEKDAAAAKAAEKQPPRRPQPPQSPADSVHRPGALYNAMIAPLIPYAIRGAIWYQGESNAGAAYQYEMLFSTMIDTWRDDWKQGDFTFLFVQLAPFMKITDQPADSAWAELRESQRQTALNVPKAGMAVITDLGDEDDIHPKQKGPVGQRLALAARKIAYGENLVSSGPTLATVSQGENGQMILTFDNVGGGLIADGGMLRGFTIAGADGKFHNAKATIEGNQVIVSCPDVPQPTAVRYGWANYPVVNLYNREGLPATPFRTDSFPFSTKPK